MSRDVFLIATYSSLEEENDNNGWYTLEDGGDKYSFVDRGIATLEEALDIADDIARDNPGHRVVVLTPVATSIATTVVTNVVIERT